MPGMEHMTMQSPVCAIDTNDETGIAMLQSLLVSAHLSSNTHS